VVEALAIAGGYLLGSLPFGYWLPLVLHREDIRSRGSGNIGASNVFRVYGRRLGTTVALLDMGKGAAAALLGLAAGGAVVGVLAGAAAMLGHARPVFLGFRKGGKMVATAGGVTLALAPLALLCCAALWIAVFVVTRYASVASIVTAFALPVSITLLGYSWPVIAFGVAGALAVVFMHRQNVRRLLSGTEHRFELRRPRRA
jgi:acyl phosphate:glycerol-3-phosphate acyltransferase